LMLFIWFISAFLYEGNSWLTLRNTRAGSHHPEQKIQKPTDAKKPGVE
jgi:hypothetical protein